MLDGQRGPGKAAPTSHRTNDVQSFETASPVRKVVEGMDVVKAILAAPVSPTKGEGPMKGQMLEPVVKIRKAQRLPG